MGMGEVLKKVESVTCLLVDNDFSTDSRFVNFYGEVESILLMIE